jgi:chromosome segregation ATPase
MARSKNAGNGRVDRLEESMSALARSQANLEQVNALLAHANASLVQNQATFLARMADIDARLSKIEAQIAESKRQNEERFTRIETILLEHSRILRALPDIIGDKIGFKSSPSQAGA